MPPKGLPTGLYARTGASSSQGMSYFEKDGDYGRDDPARREASARAGKGAEKRSFVERSIN